MTRKKCFGSLATISVVVDTDIGPFPDDVGALAILHTYANRSLVRIRAVVANDRYEGMVPVIESLNRYFNNQTGIQIGVTKDRRAGQHNSKWSRWMVENFAHPMYQRNDEAEDAVTLYRRMLATGNDHGTVIISIGYFFNLANLLDSGPDQYSPLDGVELVRRKVSHMLVMAGRFPRGEEWNIQQYPAVAKRALEQWPRPITFIGAQCGEQIVCGQRFFHGHDRFDESPVKQAWLMAEENPVYCYDEIAALLAIPGPPLYEPIYGRIEIFENGTNIWHPTANNTPAQMAYVRQVATSEQIVSIMDPLLER